MQATSHGYPDTSPAKVQRDIVLELCTQLTIEVILSFLINNGRSLRCYNGFQLDGTAVSSY